MTGIEDYPRDLIGYANRPPHADWPGKARIAVQFVLNYEEGGENNILHGDSGSEQFLSEIIGAPSYDNDFVDQEQNAYEADDSKLALSLSVDFHRQLAKMSGNGVLEEYLNDIIRRTPLVILTHLSTDPQNRCRNQEHEEIVDAIEAGDAKKAARIMNQHLLHIENRIQHKSEDPEPDLATLLLSS